MSNTGHKCVHYHQGMDRYVVAVQWKGELRAAWLQASEYDLADAVARRDEFERELGKPRTERKIHHGANPLRGVYRRVRRGLALWVAMASPDPGGEAHLYAQFRIDVYGEVGARARAIERRRGWEVEFYAPRRA